MCGAKSKKSFYWNLIAEFFYGFFFSSFLREEFVGEAGVCYFSCARGAALAKVVIKVS